MWAHEVVMPHEGHRNPYHCTSVHGGRPNCWCVPIPRGLGVSRLAVMSSPISTAPAKAMTSRCGQGKRQARGGTAGAIAGGGE
jgi:hypothetical protein